MTLNFPRPQSLSRSHQTPNSRSRSNTIFPNELRWFDWFAVPTMIWALEISSDGDFKPSKPEWLYAIGEKPSVADGPKSSSDNRSRRGWLMSWRKTKRTNSPWSAGPPNARSAWIIKGYRTSNESTSTPNQTRW